VNLGRSSYVLDCPLPHSGELSIWAAPSADRTLIVPLCSLHLDLVLKAMRAGIDPESGRRRDPLLVHGNLRLPRPGRFRGVYLAKVADCAQRCSSRNRPGTSQRRANIERK
jgi:hypothetical protein